MNILEKFSRRKGAPSKEQELKEEERLTLIPVKLRLPGEIEFDSFAASLPFLTEVIGIDEKTRFGKKKGDPHLTFPSGIFISTEKKNSSKERQKREERIAAIARKELDVPVIGGIDSFGGVYIIDIPPFSSPYPFTAHQIKSRRLTPERLDDISNDVGEELALKIYENDLIIWQRVVDQLVETIGDRQLSAEWEKRKETLNAKFKSKTGVEKRIETRSQAHRNIIRNFLAKLGETRGGEQLNLDLRRVYNEIYLEEELKYIEKVGPQKPFLIAQMIFNFEDEEVTPKMINRVMETSPIMAIFYNTVLNFISLGDINEYSSWGEVVKYFKTRIAKVERDYEFERK